MASGNIQLTLAAIGLTLTDVDSTSALYLEKNDRFRFIPDVGETGAQAISLW